MCTARTGQCCSSPKIVVLATITRSESLGLRSLDCGVGFMTLLRLARYCSVTLVVADITKGTLRRNHSWLSITLYSTSSGIVANVKQVLLCAIARFFR